MDTTHTHTHTHTHTYIYTYIYITTCLFFFHGATGPSSPVLSDYQRFTITLRHSTLGRTPLDLWQVKRRDLYLTTHNTQKRHTSMPPAEFELAIPAS